MSPRCTDIPAFSIFLAALLAAPLTAQVALQSAATTISTGATAGTANSVSSLAVAANGDLYAAQVQGNNVFRFPANGSGPISIVLGPSGCSTTCRLASSVAVDASGNLYVATSNAGLLVIASGTTTVSALPVTGVTQSQSPSAVSVVGTSLYVADASGGSGGVVYKVPVGAAGGAATIIENGAAYTSVTADPSGNVYVVGASANTVGVYKYSAGAYAASVVTIPGPSGAWTNPAQMATDASGDLYVANSASLIKVASPGSSNTLTTVAAAAEYFTGVALDAQGNLYWSTWRGAGSSGTDLITELAASSANFRGWSVASPSSVTTLTFTFTGSKTLNAATPVLVLTQGAAGLDYAAATGGSAGTCAAAAYSAGQTCTVNVIFTPQAPGLREGAVVLEDNSATPLRLATVFLAGTGLGAASTFQTASLTLNTLATLSGGKVGVGVDAAGDVFYGDNANSTILKQPVGGGAAAVVASGVSLTGQIAVDGAGNIYAAGTNYDEVYRIDAATGALAYPGGAFTGQVPGVAVDGAGNLYAADYANSRILEIPANGGSSIAYPLPSADPYTLALDGQGDLFVASPNGNSATIFELNLATKTVATAFTLSPDASFFQGIAVDSAGAVYVADTNYGLIKFSTPGSNAYQVLVAGPDDGGSVLASNVAVDAKGNIAYVDITGSPSPVLVRQIPLATLPNLAFGSVALGASSAAQSVVFANVGNQNLTISNLSVPNYFASTATGAAACSASSSLAASASCNLSLTFDPNGGAGGGAGSYSALVSISSNVLNGAPAIQSIAVSGTGTQGPAAKLAFAAAPAPVALGANAGTVTVDEDDSNGIVENTDSSNSVTVAITGPGSFNRSVGPIILADGVASVNLGSLSFSVAGAYTLTASSSLNGVASATASLVVLANSATAGSETVGASSGILSVTFASPAAAVGAIAVLTNGHVSTSDFVAAAGASAGTCVVGTQTAGPTCTVNYTFQPSTAGLRKGAAVLYDQNNLPLATIYLSGTGNGPVAAFSAAPAVVATGLTGYPYGLATDGTSFYTTGAGNLEKISGATVADPVTTLSSSLAYALALDGAGNLFALSSGSSASLLEFANDNGTLSPTPATIADNLAIGSSAFNNLAVDGAGNLYVAAGALNAILEYPAGATSPATLNQSGVAIANPATIALDGAGNVFFTSSSSSGLFEIAAGGTAVAQLSSSVYGSNSPVAIALDSAGNLYEIPSAASAEILEFANPTIQPSLLTTYTVTGGSPTGLVVAASGSIFFPIHSASPALGEINVAAAPTAFSFGSQDDGTSATQSTTISDVGNANLALSSMAPPAAGPFASTGTCSTAVAITPGENDFCTAAASFTPASPGAQSASLTLAYNAPGSPLALALAGTGLATALSPNAGATPQSALVSSLFATPLSVTLLDSSNNPVAGVTVTFTVNPVAGAGAAFTGGSTTTGLTGASGIAIALSGLTANAAVGAYTVTASAPDAASATFALTNLAPATQLLLTPAATAVPVGGSVTFTVTAASAAGVADTLYQGALDISSTDLIAEFPSNTGITNGAGTVTVTFNTAGNQTITVSDGSLSGTSSLITVVPVAAPTLAATAVGVSATGTATLYFAAATPVASIQAATPGTPDFALTAGGTCATAPFTPAAGSACTVNYIFTPSAPGLRSGAIVAFGSSSPGAPLATALLSGVGAGPIAAFPAVASTLVSGLSASAVADATDDTYVYFTQGSSIDRVPIGGGATATVASGLAGLADIKLDGAGNLYALAAAGVFQCLRQSDGSFSSCAQIETVADGISLALDPLGDLFVAQVTASSSTLLEYPTGGDAAITLATGAVGAVADIAFDQVGDLYYAANGAVAEVSAASLAPRNSYPASTTIAIATTGGFAFDAAGDLFTPGPGGAVLEYPFASQLATTASTLAAISGASIAGLAIASSGSLYAADAANRQIVALSLRTPPSFAFPSTPVAQNSSPISTTVSNLGNADLTIATVTSGDAAHFANTGTCAASGSTTLAASSGQTCTVAVVFTPNSTDPIAAASDTIADNDFLNSSQPIALTAASGTLTPTTLALPAPSSPVYGADVSTLATVATPSGGAPAFPVPTGTLTAHLDSASDLSPVALVAGAATLALGQLDAGPHVLHVAYSGDAVYAAIPDTTVDFTVATATLVPSLTGSVTKVYDATTAATLSPGNFSLAGIQSGDNPGISTTLGAYATADVGSGLAVSVSGLALTGAGAANYTLSTSSLSAAIGVITPAPLAVTALPATSVAGQALPSFSASFSGFQGADNASLISGAPGFTTNAPSPTTVGVYTITPTVNGMTAANYSFTTFDTALLTVTPAAIAAAPTVVGATSSAFAVTFPFASPTTVGSVAVRGGGSSDFASADSSHCVASFASGQTCTVDVTFTPTAPGLRSGAVVLYASGGQVLQTAYLSGVGLGAALAYPGNLVVSALGAGYVNPAAVALDAAGDSFILDSGANTVVEVAFNGVQTTPLTLGDPVGAVAPALAVDGAGNLYLANAAGVVRVPNETGGLNLTDTVTLATLAGADSLAVDGAGNVYASTAAGGSIAVISPAGVLATMGNGVSPNAPVALDSAGDIYTVSGTSILEISPGGSQSTMASGLAAIQSLAVDAAGDIYAATAAGLVLIPAAAPAAPITLSNSSYVGMAVSPQGELSVVNGALAARLAFSAPPAAFADFGSQTIGQAAAAAAPLVLQNVGSAALSFTSISTGDSDFSTGATSCAVGAPLAAGASCSLAPAFTPTSAAGALASTLNIATSIAALSFQLAGTGVLIPQTISFPAAAVSTYGAAPITLVATGGGSSAPVTFSLKSGSSFASLSGSTLTITGVGTVVIAANQAATTTYAAAPEADQILTIGPATLTLTAANAATTYGAALPAFTGTVTGAENGDTFTETFSTAATLASPTGTYAITPAVIGINLSDYTVVPINGTLTVGKATLTIAASNAATTYGAALPTFTGTATGAQNGDTFTETFSTTATIASPVGTYAITPAVTGTNLTDYTVVPINGTLTVGKATLTITASNAATTYGAALPTFTGTATGAENGDTFTETFSISATAASPVGMYAITPAVTGTNLTDYTVVPTNGTLTVGNATLIITASNATTTYGATLPTFTGTVTGAENGDTFTETFSTAATASSPAGSYAITPAVTGTNLADYTVVPTNGTLTVGKATLTITASNAATTYGATLPTFTGTVTGAENGDTFTETFSTSATIASPAGTYSITPAVAGTNLTDYTVVPTDGTLTVGKATLTITAANAATTYGSPLPTFTGTVTGAENGDTFTETFSTTATASSPIGSFSITPAVTGTNLADYTIAPTNGTLTVGKATLTITASNALSNYGSPLPTFSGTVTGQQNGDTFTETFSTTATASSAIGSFSITPAVTGTNLADYTIAPTNGTLTVGKATLTIAASNAATTYGATLPAFTGTVTGAENGDTFTETFSTSATASSPVGSYAITPAVAGTNLADYTVVPTNGTLTVGKATLTIAASNAATTYGAALPTFVGTVTGAENGDTFTETFSTTATASSPVGSFSITPAVTGTNLADYTVVPTNGTLTVGKATLTIAASNATTTYGATLPTFAGTVTGAENGDTFTETFSTTATATSPAGTYAITPAVTGTNLADYTVAPTNGTLTVGKATLTITASNAATTYGGSLPTFAGTVTGAQNGDNFTETFSTTATAASPVGSYAITPAVTGTNLADYTVVPTNGTLTISKATLTITASNAATTYGGSLPTFTGTVTGAANGDNFTETFSTSATASSPVGTYAITPAVAGTNLADYTVAPTNGTLTVGKATLTITASNALSNYGSPLPTFAGTVTGQQNGDAFTETFSTPATAASTIGTYSITPAVTGTNLADYTVVPTNGMLTIGKATLTITASNATTTYGGSLPTFTGTVTGAENGDTFTESFSTAATATSPAGPYSITPTITGTNLADYTVAPTNGTLTISKATLTITASNAATTYGGSLPTFTGTVTGAENGDTFTETFSTTATASSPVGTYAITPAVAGTNLADYTVAPTNGTLTIGKATLTITASNALSNYGSPLPTFTGTVTGAENGDTFTETFSTTATTASPAGTYAITPAVTGTNLADYTIAPTNGTLTIVKATLTITASNALSNYGSPLPTFSGTVTGQQNGDIFTETFSTTATATSPTGTYPITPTAVGVNLADYSVVATTGTLTITTDSQTITFAPLASATYGAAPLALVATASSGLPVTFTAAGPAAVSLTPSDAMLTITGGGVVTVTAVQAGNADFVAAAPVSRSFTVAPAAQTIAFAAVPLTLPGTVVALVATASSGLPVSFTLLSGAAALSGNQLSVLGAGAITIEASQAGNTNYLAASAVDQTINVGVPAVTLSAASLSFGSQTINASSSAQTVTVTNSGASTLHVSAVAAAPPFSAVTNCAAIAPGASCSINVTFTPVAAGAASGSLSITDDASSSPQTVTLAGAGIAPGIALTPAAISFGAQVVGTASAAQSLTLVNTGSAALDLASAVASGDFSLAGNCSIIAAGSQCSLGVSFTPSAPGARVGSITLTDNAGGGAQTVAATGMGTAPGVAVSPSSLVFPPTVVGAASFIQTVTLTNTGTAPLTSIQPSLAGDFSLASAASCGSTLAPGASCAINLIYNPTLAGAESGTLTLADSLGAQPVELNGTGLAPGVNLSSNLLVFGGQLVSTASNAQTVVVTNSGTAALAIASVTASAGFTAGGNCAGTLAVGASCGVNVAFSPASSGAQTGIITLLDAAGTQTIAAAGVGTVPGLALDPSTASFGAEPVGASSAAQTLTLANTGTALLTLNPRLASGDFAEADTCTATLAPGADCQISLTFTPTAIGSRTGSIAITDASGVASTLASLSGAGTLPGIAASPGTVFFGSQPVGLPSAAQTVTVVNTGTAPLTLSAVTVTGDFSQDTTCAASLAPGANCVVSLIMTPTSMGARTGALSIFDNADGVYTVALSGVGQAPGINLAPAALAFGSAPLASAGGAITLAGTPQTVSLTNTGTAPLAITAIAVDGDFTQTNTCASAIASGASCTVSVSFSPTGLGHRTGTLTIASNSASGTQQVSLAGDGSPTGLSLSPAALSFGGGAVGQPSAPQSATLTNATGSDISALAITASGEFSETDDCGAALANGASCTLQIVLTPATSGAITGTISIAGGLADLSTGSEASDGSGLRGPRAVASSTHPNVAVVALTGSGTPAGIALSAATLTFTAEPVGNPSSSQSITIADSGSAALTGLAIASTPDFPATSTCGASLAAGSNCAVAVTFDPTAAGQRTGSLTVTADGGLSAQVALSGAAIGGQLSLNPSALAFGALAVDTTSAAQVVTIRNSGSAPLSLQSIALPGNDFALGASTCGALPQTLAANAACAVAVTYTPTALGAESATLTVASNYGAELAALSGSGSSQGLELSAASLSFAAQGVGLASPAQILTLTNGSPAAIAMASITATGDYQQANNCPASLAPSANCAVAVTYTPSVSGAEGGAITIVNSAATQTVTLTGTGTNYSLAATTSSVQVDAGGTAAFQLSFTPGSFSGSVSLACSGLPNAAACSFAPSSLTLTAGAAPSSASFRVTTTSRDAAFPPARGPRSRRWMLAWLLAALGLLLAALQLVFAGAARRGLVAALLIGALAAAGCGGVTNLAYNNDGTAAGTYVITVTSTAGAATQTTTVTLSVN